MANSSATGGVQYKVVDTFKVADSQTIEEMDPLYLSSGKVVQYNSAGIVPNTCIGFASEDKTVTTLATEGFQKYIGVRRKGIMSFTGLIDTGSYTGSISIGDRVSLYCDGSGTYYVVSNVTNPIGQVVEGSMDTAGSSTTILVSVDLTSESIIPAEIGFPLLVPTDSKIQFRDTGIFLQSSADGKLLISADGTGADDIIFTGNVTFNNDVVITGTASIPAVGGTFTGTVQINDNFSLQLEGVSGTPGGLTLNCDAAGDTKMDSTAGYLEFNCKDAVFIFQDSDDSNVSDYLNIRVADAGSVCMFEAEPSGIFRFLDANAGTPSTTDYLQITVTDAGSRAIIAAEPSGLFRFKDAGDSNNSDVIDLDLTDTAAANKLTSAVGFEIETTAGNITLDAAGDIVMTATGADVTMNAPLSITKTGEAQLILIESGSVATTFQVAATTGLCTVTTAGGTANSFEIATGTAGDITLDSAGNIYLEPGAASTITATLPTAGYISIDAGTADTTASNVISMNVDVNSTNVNAIGMDVDVGTALSAGEIVNGLYIDIDGNAGDNAGAYLNGISLTSANTTGGVNRGISMVGTWDTGIYLVPTSLTTAFQMDLATADDNAMKGIYITKDMTVVGATGTSANTNSALSVVSTNATSTAASGAMTVANNLVVITETNSAALATADVYSGSLLALTYSATTTGAGTATTTATAINIDYNLTETAGTLTVDDFNIINIDFDMVGTLAVANSTINMIQVNMNDDSTNVYGTVAMNGMLIDCSGLDVSDTSFTLSGINIVMPGTYGNATEYGVYVAGDGTTVALCSDGAIAMAVGGTITVGLDVTAAATGIDVGNCPIGISFTDVGAAAENAILFVAAYAGHSITTGTYASAHSNAVILTSSNDYNAAFLADDGNANIGASVRNLLGRTVLATDQSAGSIRSVMGQLKCLTTVDLATGVYAGVQGYLEFVNDNDVQSGGKVSAVDASIEVADAKTLTVDSGGMLAGIHCELTSGGTSTVTQTGNSAGVYIDTAGTITNWKVGVDINSCTTGVDVGASTIAYNISGNVTTGYNIAGNATDAFKVSSGTIGTALNIAGAVTTGVLVAGATTTGLSVTGNSTTALNIGTGTIGTGVLIGGTLTTGVSVGACGTAYTITGAVTTGYNVAGNATDAFKITSGTIGTALNIASAVTTGVLVAGATTTALSVTGNATTALNIGTGTIGTGVLIGGTLTTGVSVGACGTAYTITGNVTTGYNLAGNATDAFKVTSGTVGTAFNAGTVTTGLSVTAATTAVSIGNCPTGIVNTDVGATTEHFLDMVDAYTGLVIETGSYSSSASKGVTINATNARPASFLFDDAGVAFATGDIRPLLGRTAITTNHTADNVRFAGNRGHLKIANGVTISGGATEYYASQGLIEAAGTLTVGAAGDGTSYTMMAGVCGMLWLDGNLTSVGLTAGVMSKLYQTAGTTAATTSAFMATKWWNSADTWGYGLYIHDSCVDTGHDIRLQSGALIGSGTAVPSHTATQGSIYLRTGQAQNATLYINTDGAGTWALCNSLA